MLQPRKEKTCITAVRPGAILANPVIREDDGYVVLAEGTVLTQGHINRLRNLSFHSLDITHPAELDLTTLEGFAATYISVVADLKEAFATMRCFGELPLCQMKEVAESRIRPLTEAKGVINHLRCMRRQDDYTYYHSVNVAIICGVLGKWVGYTGSEIQELILAGLLHDIGKIKIPLAILNKPGRLSPSEMEEMSMHAVLGYQLLRKHKGLPQSILRGVLEHHERIDGSGYPHQLEHRQMHPFACVIAIADIYDAMTSDRVYQKKRTPFAVVEEINTAMFGKLDPCICTTFLNNVKSYFIGSIIRLSDGREAEVVFMEGRAASRPVVRTEQGEFIDLEADSHISIEGIAETVNK